MPAVNQSALTSKLTGFTIEEGHILLTAELGHGTYGTVYRALNLDPFPRSPKVYAVKCLNKIGLTPLQRQFQAREIALHKAASPHTNVVTIHRTFEEMGCVFFVLDYCPDGDLYGMITERYLYIGNDDLIKHVYLQLLDGMEFCHKIGVYHRDLKPENILCAQDGQKLLIADFGLATSDRSSVEFGCGSSHYTSPGICFLAFRIATRSSAYRVPTI